MTNSSEILADRPDGQPPRRLRVRLVIATSIVVLGVNLLLVSGIVAALGFWSASHLMEHPWETFERPEEPFVAWAAILVLQVCGAFCVLTVPRIVLNRLLIPKDGAGDAPRYTDLSRGSRSVRRASQAHFPIRWLSQMTWFLVGCLAAGEILALLGFRTGTGWSPWVVAAAIVLLGAVAAILWAFQQNLADFHRGAWIYYGSQGYPDTLPRAIGVGIRFGCQAFRMLLAVVWVGLILLTLVAHWMDPMPAVRFLEASPVHVALAPAQLYAAAWVAAHAHPTILLVMAVWVPLVLNYELTRASTRLATREIECADEVQGYEYAVWLRSFDEDSARLCVESLRVRFAQYLSPHSWYRFEETVVAALSGSGVEVVAVSPPDVKVPPLGAIRAKFLDQAGSRDRWKDEVRSLCNGGLFVIISATPGSMNEGFMWEIETFARDVPHQRVLLLVGPWRNPDRGRRLTRFMESAQGEEPFSKLASLSIPEGVHALYFDRGRWHALGSSARDDASYSTCLSEFMGVASRWRQERKRRGKGSGGKKWTDDLPWWLRRGEIG